METNNSFSRLRELRGSGYEIVDGEPDIIGWTIRDSSDRKIGVVHDLLFEPETQKVRYIIANLKDNDYDLEKRKVLIPIGLAQIHENSDIVMVNAVSPWQIRALPTYDKNMTIVDEQDIYAIFGVAGGALTNTSQTSQSMYNHTNYDYNNLFRNRQKDEAPHNEFHIRQREANSLDTPTREYDPNQYVHEPDAMTVRDDRDRFQDSENARDHDTRKERLIDRIKHMKDDLNEIERDLRNSRDL